MMLEEFLNCLSSTSIEGLLHMGIQAGQRMIYLGWRETAILREYM